MAGFISKRIRFFMRKGELVLPVSVADIEFAPRGGIPISERAEPLRGIKHARIDVDPVTGRFVFGAMYTGSPYGVEAHAECHRHAHSPHNVPHLNCTCGFYAYKPGYQPFLWNAESHMSPLVVELDTDLAGRVIVCEQGYRAEWQRVMRATIVAFRCTQAIEPLTTNYARGGPAATTYAQMVAKIAATSITATMTTGACDSWGAPLCNQPAVAMRNRDAMREHMRLTDTTGIGITFCKEHAESLDPLCWNELEFGVLNRLRADLPTEWVTI